MSTHIVSDVEYIADRIVLIKNGSAMLNDAADSICSAIDGMVWECTVSPNVSDELAAKHVVTNLHNTHDGDGAVLRIVSETRPVENATPAEPKLEDLYLYYFRKELSDEPDKA